MYQWQHTKTFKKENEEEEIKETQTCDICQKLCKSKGGLASHKIKIHNQYPIITQIVSTTWCPICLKFFDTIQRTKKHLFYNKKCQEILILNFPKLSTNQFIDTLESTRNTRLKSKNEGYNEYKAENTQMNVEGPLQNFINPPFLNYLDKRSNYCDGILIEATPENEWPLIIPQQLVVTYR